MSPAVTLKVASHLLVQADRIRSTFPEVAAAREVADALEADCEELVANVPALPVADVAELLGFSRPTIYEWLRAGYLLSVDASSNGVSISPESLIALMPILEQWADEGGPGRPTRLLRRWFQGELQLQRDAEEFAAHRRADASGLRPPRRQAPELAGTR